MKKITILLAMILWSGAVTHAQKLVVTAPSNIAGTFNFTAADPANGWGNVAITSNYINVGVVLADDGTAKPSEACNPLTAANAALMPGKAALIDRGSCNFSDKALYAQNAGAIMVIIVNNEPFGRIGMTGAAPAGAQVNIPVIMISKGDGDMLKAELANNPTITLTPWSLGLPFDLAIEQGDQVKPFNLTQPYFLLDHAATTSSDYEYYYGYRGATFWRNYSSDTIDTLYQYTRIVDASNLYWADSAAYYITTDSNKYMPTTGAPASWPQGFEPDTEGVYVFDNTYDMTQLPVGGQYSVENYIDVLQGDNDQYDADNVASCMLTLTDSTYGKASLQADKTSIHFDGAFAPSGVSEWGQILHFPYIKGSDNKDLYMDYVNVSLFLSVRAGTLDLDGKAIQVNIYKWTDDNADDAIQETELTSSSNQLCSEDTTFTAGTLVDANTRTLEVQVPIYNIDNGEKGIKIDPEGIYWVSVKLDGSTNIGFCIDNSADNSDRRRLFVFSSQNASPYSGLQDQGLITDQFYTGYANTGQPAMNVTLAARLDYTATENVDENLGIKVYPNPAANFTNLEVKTDGVQDYISYTLMDITGQVVAQQTMNNTADANFRLDVANLAAGSYIIKVMTPEGYNTEKFIKK